MVDTRHMVNALHLNFSFSDEVTAMEIHPRLSDMTRNKLKYVIEKVLNKYDRKDQYIKIDELVLDMTLYAGAGFEYDYLQEAGKQLDEKLSAVLGEALHIKQDTVKITSPESHRIQLLTSFLMNGFCTGRAVHFSMDKLMQQCIDATPQKLITLLKQHIRKSAFRLRLVRQFTDKVLYLLIQKAEPDEAEFIRHYIEQVPAISVSDCKITYKERREATFSITFLYLFADRGSRFNRKSYLRYHLEHLKQLYQLSFTALMNELLVDLAKVTGYSGKSELLQLMVEIKDECSTCDPKLLLKTDKQSSSSDLLRSVFLMLNLAIGSSGYSGKQDALTGLFNSTGKNEKDKLLVCLRNPKYLSQIIQNDSDEVIGRIICFLEPGNAEYIIDFAHEMDTIAKKETPHFKVGSDFRHCKWTVILSLLADKSGSVFNRKSFAKALLTRMAAHYNTTYWELLQMFYVSLGDQASVYKTNLSNLDIIRQLYEEEINLDSELRLKSELAKDKLVLDDLDASALQSLIWNMLEKGEEAYFGITLVDGLNQLAKRSKHGFYIFISLLMRRPVVFSNLVKCILAENKRCNAYSVLLNCEDRVLAWELVRQLLRLIREQRLILSAQEIIQDAITYSLYNKRTTLTGFITQFRLKQMERGATKEKQAIYDEQVITFAKKHSLNVAALLPHKNRAGEKALKQKRLTQQLALIDQNTLSEVLAWIQGDETIALPKDVLVSILDSIVVYEPARCRNKVVKALSQSDATFLSAQIPGEILDKILFTLFPYQCEVLLILKDLFSQVANHLSSGDKQQLTGIYYQTLFSFCEKGVNWKELLVLLCERMEPILKREPEEIMTALFQVLERKSINIQQKTFLAAQFQNLGNKGGDKNRDSIDTIDKKRSTDEVLSLALGEEIYIHNAGLVIAAPYLPLLFDRLQMLEKGRFINSATAIRAVQLIQYLCSGSTNTPEVELVLNKILCGVTNEMPVPLNFEITEKEKTIIHELLSDIIKQWKILRNTSLAGLRESFLQRNGVLMLKGEEWHLKVEEKAFDMLLDQLPWPYTPIKNRFMKRMLVVHWR